MLHIFNGKQVENHYQPDISLILHPLPKLPKSTFSDYHEGYEVFSEMTRLGASVLKKRHHNLH
jgi:hypothetical protein